MSKPKFQEVLLEEIEASGATQVRRALDKHTVTEYAEAIQSRAVFPPLVVFAEKGSERYLLADGFHRLEAAKQAGLLSFACELHKGGVREALAYALGANDQHGLRRNNKDKHGAVEIALKDPEWCTWANTEISRLCRVSEFLVRKVRDELVLKGEIDDQERVKTMQDGNVVRQRKGARSDKGREESGTSETGSIKSNRQPKTQDEVNREELYAALDIIKSMPFGGAEAVQRWGSERQGDLDYCREWLEEAAQECARLEYAA